MSSNRRYPRAVLMVIPAAVIVLGFVTWIWIAQRLANERMYEAVTAGDLASVRRLAEADPRSVHAVVTDLLVKDTMLHAAVLNHHVAVAEYLVRKGADINAGDYNGGTPLLAAAESNDIAMVRTLVHLGADVRRRNHWSETPLHKAAANGNLAMTRVLLENGADIHVRDKWGDTPIDVAKRLHHAKVVTLLKSWPKGIHYPAGTPDW